jgi:Protein of unknown function (DUF3052)
MPPLLMLSFVSGDGAMADIAAKLQVKGDRTLAVLNAKPALDRAIGAARAAPAKADVVVFFASNKAALEAKLPGLLAKLRPESILWVAYPKLTSALAGDLSRDGIREWAPALGLDTVSQIAIDEDWSALRLKPV